jgi:hypothetical protein
MSGYNSALTWDRTRAACRSWKFRTGVAFESLRSFPSKVTVDLVGQRGAVLGKTNRSRFVPLSICRII